MDIKEIRGQLDDRRQKLHEIFEQAGPVMDMAKVTLLEGTSAEKVDRIKVLNDEIDDLAKQQDGFNELAAMRDKNDSLSDIDRKPMHAPQGGVGRRVEQTKSLGELIVSSDAYKNHRPGSRGMGQLSELDLTPSEIKATLFETTAGWAPESTRTGRVVDKALRPIQLLDLIPTAATGQAAVVYMEETTATSGAATRAEGAVYVASQLALTQNTKTVRSIGTSLPVTDEQLEDVAQAQSYIDGRLGFFVRQHLDDQIMNGNDIAPQLDGILGFTNLQTQAKAADPAPDAVYKAMTKIRVTGRATPSAIVIHPNDWQDDFRLLRTADGIYIWGNPSESGPERVWGLLVVQADVIAENTAVVGDFSPAMLQLYIRRGLEVQVGYDSSDFIDGKQTVRAGIRAALVCYRGAAFCAVTGL